MLKLLRATFKHLHPHLSDGSNPFHGLVTKATETVNREPFTVEELKAITETCADDDFIRPIIVTGMCTAMRRGDCCLLKWADVDLKAGFLSVETAKTGETVDIPIFPMLAEELTKAKAKAGTSEFCFPEAAQMYRNNPDGITWRVKQVIARALESLPEAGRPALPPPGKPGGGPSEGRGLPDGLGTRSTSAEDASRLRGLRRGGQPRRGHGGDRVQPGNGVELPQRTRTRDWRLDRSRPPARGEDRRAAEGPRERPATGLSARFPQLPRHLDHAGAGGRVPLELVQRVTGHRTVAVVLKHYFRPGREDFRQVLARRCPRCWARDRQGP
jgi:hypothetical protein